MRLRLPREQLAHRAPPRQIYLCDQRGGKPYSWTVGADGVLTEIPGGPMTTGDFAENLVFDAVARFAYVTNSASSDLYIYEINAAGRLIEQQALRVDTDSHPLLSSSLSFSPGGKFAYLVNAGFGPAPGSLIAFSVNAANGALTPINGSPYALPVMPAPSPHRDLQCRSRQRRSDPGPRFESGCRDQHSFHRDDRRGALNRRR